MNTKTLKFSSHALVFMMIVELAVMNINISAFSIIWRRLMKKRQPLTWQGQIFWNVNIY